VSPDCPACGSVYRVTLLPEVRQIIEQHHAMDSQKDAAIAGLAQRLETREAYWQGVRDGLAQRLAEQTKRAETAEYSLDATTNGRNRLSEELDHLRGALRGIATDYRDKAEQSDPEIVNTDVLREFARRIDEVLPRG
jgi:predicted  nucleic acid-binding Zn-ribbon protein